MLKKVNRILPPFIHICLGVYFFLYSLQLLPFSREQAWQLRCLTAGLGAVALACAVITPTLPSDFFWRKKWDRKVENRISRSEDEQGAQCGEGIRLPCILSTARCIAAFVVVGSGMVMLVASLLMAPEDGLSGGGFVHVRWFGVFSGALFTGLGVMLVVKLKCI